MITTTYICDKCGSEQTTNENFWNVGVAAQHVNYPFNDKQYVTGKTMQVCRPCLESFGINVQKKKDVEPPKPPSVEDLIREIISRCSE